MDVHPLELKLIELEERAAALRAEADRTFAAARDLDRRALDVMAEAKAVAAQLDAYDREQAAAQQATD